MAINEITIWELKQIFKGKKFTYAFIIQFFVILAIIPLFDVYSEMLEDPTHIILPTSKGYIPVAITSSPLEEPIDSQPIFRIYKVTEEKALHLLKTHAVCCYISGTTIIFDEYNPKSRVAEFHLQKLLQQEPDIPVNYNLNEKPVVSRQRLVARELALREIRKTAELMQSEQINYSTLLILLLAIFLAAGILVDLVVSEKEKQTGEILLSIPVPGWKVLLSKIAAVVIVLILQIVLWIGTLYVLGRVSTLASMVPLFLTAFLIVSLTALASAYAESYKEAGFAITVSYVLLFAFLMSGFAFYTYSEQFSFLSPLSLVVQIERGQSSILEVLYAGVPTFVLSCLLTFLAVKIYERDEFYFGPRPSLLRMVTIVSAKTAVIAAFLAFLFLVSVYYAVTTAFLQVLLVIP
ncbi:MAG: ABC transporter permease [Candidatus Methanofastidiosia archaeon]|jgi:hypothetical protein